MKMLIASALALAVSAAQAQSGFQFRVVDFPGAVNTAAIAVNNFGTVVGFEKDTANTHHAIIEDAGGLRLLDPHGLIGTAGQSWAFSINNRDDIAGAYTDSSLALHGYVLHADHSITRIDFPGGVDTQAFGVNDLGEVIGIYNDAQGNGHAFLLREGRYRNIDLPGGVANQGTEPFSINDRGEIVGEFANTDGTQGFGYLQKPDGRFTLTTAPGSAPQQTFYISINNRQQILGSFLDINNGNHNFLKTGDDFRPFDVPASFGASSVSVQTINDEDEIVGFYFDASNRAHGFVAIRARY